MLIKIKYNNGTAKVFDVENTDQLSSPESIERSGSLVAKKAISIKLNNDASTNVTSVKLEWLDQYGAPIDGRKFNKIKCLVAS